MMMTTRRKTLSPRQMRSCLAEMAEELGAGERGQEAQADGWQGGRGGLWGDEEGCFVATCFSPRSGREMEGRLWFDAQGAEEQKIWWKGSGVEEVAVQARDVRSVSVQPAERGETGSVLRVVSVFASHQFAVDASVETVQAALSRITPVEALPAALSPTKQQHQYGSPAVMPRVGSGSKQPVLGNMDTKENFQRRRNSGSGLSPLTPSMSMAVSPVKQHQQQQHQQQQQQGSDDSQVVSPTTTETRVPLGRLLPMDSASNSTLNTSAATATTVPGAAGEGTEPMVCSPLPTVAIEGSRHGGAIQSARGNRSAAWSTASASPLLIMSPAATPPFGARMPRRSGRTPPSPRRMSPATAAATSPSAAVVAPSGANVPEGDLLQLSTENATMMDAGEDIDEVSQHALAELLADDSRDMSEENLLRMSQYNEGHSDATATPQLQFADPAQHQTWADVIGVDDDDDADDVLSAASNVSDLSDCSVAAVATDTSVASHQSDWEVDEDARSLSSVKSLSAASPDRSAVVAAVATEEKAEFMAEEKDANDHADTQVAIEEQRRLQLEREQEQARQQAAAEREAASALLCSMDLPVRDMDTRQLVRSFAKFSCILNGVLSKPAPLVQRQATEQEMYARLLTISLEVQRRTRYTLAPRWDVQDLEEDQQTGERRVVPPRQYGYMPMLSVQEKKSHIMDIMPMLQAAEQLRGEETRTAEAFTNCKARRVAGGYEYTDVDTGETVSCKEFERRYRLYLDQCRSAKNAVLGEQRLDSPPPPQKKEELEEDVVDEQGDAFEADDEMHVDEEDSGDMCEDDLEEASEADPENKDVEAEEQKQQNEAEQLEDVKDVEGEEAVDERKELELEQAAHAPDEAASTDDADANTQRKPVADECMDANEDNQSLALPENEDVVAEDGDDDLAMEPKPMSSSFSGSEDGASDNSPSPASGGRHNRRSSPRQRLANLVVRSPAPRRGRRGSLLRVDDVFGSGAGDESSPDDANGVSSEITEEQVLVAIPPTPPPVAASNGGGGGGGHRIPSKRGRSSSGTHSPNSARELAAATPTPAKAPAANAPADCHLPPPSAVPASCGPQSPHRVARSPMGAIALEEDEKEESGSRTPINNSSAVDSVDHEDAKDVDASTDAASPSSAVDPADTHESDQLQQQQQRSHNKLIAKRARKSSTPTSLRVVAALQDAKRFSPPSDHDDHVDDDDADSDADAEQQGGKDNADEKEDGKTCEVKEQEEEESKSTEDPESAEREVVELDWVQSYPTSFGIACARDAVRELRREQPESAAAFSLCAMDVPAAEKSSDDENNAPEHADCSASPTFATSEQWVDHQRALAERRMQLRLKDVMVQYAREVAGIDAAHAAQCRSQERAAAVL